MSKTTEAILKKWECSGSSDVRYVEDNILEAMNEYADQRVSEALSSQWVSVKERLPERNNLVLTYRPDPHSVYLLEIDYWSLNSEKNADHFSSEYTHWQPLPSPPLNH